MHFKKIIPYILVFFMSFFGTSFLITSFVKKANENAKKYVKNFSPFTINLSNGIYHGKYKAFGIITMSKVQFEIENGFVKNIDFKRMFHSPGSPYKKSIENQIKQTGKLEVNAISGATRTSNFAKAAIKNAFENQNIK